MAACSMFYSSYIFLDVHLYILVATAILGAVSFGVVEYWGKLQPEEMIKDETEKIPLKQ